MGLRKIIKKPVRIAGILAESHTDHLPNKCQEVACEPSCSADLYCDTDSEEDLDGSHISSADSQESDYDYF
jgi:hypothetical protein